MCLPCDRVSGTKPPPLSDYAQAVGSSPKAGKCIVTKSGSRKEIGRMIDICKVLKYSSIMEEEFIKEAPFPTSISMWCCDGILWMTEDKRVVSAIDSTREAVGFGVI